MRALEERRARLEAAGWRGQMQRYPLSLSLLCEAPPDSDEAIRDAFPAAQSADPAVQYTKLISGDTEHTDRKGFVRNPKLVKEDEKEMAKQRVNELKVKVSASR